MKTIEVPDDIDALDLAIQDKVALATIRKRRRIPNGALVKELGLSDSGVRTMIRRFKQQGLLRELNIEGERQFEVMVDELGIRQPGCQKVTKKDAIEIRQKLTAEPPAGLTPEERTAWKCTYYADALLSLENAMLTLNTCRMCGYYAVEFQRRIEQVEADADVPEAYKKTLLTCAQYGRNHQVAVGYAVDHLPRKKAVEVLKVLQAATPDQLAKLYDRIQAGQTLGEGAGATALLLDIGSPLGSDVQKPRPNLLPRWPQKDSEQLPKNTGGHNGSIGRRR